MSSPMRVALFSCALLACTEVEGAPPASGLDGGGADAGDRIDGARADAATVDAGPGGDPIGIWFAREVISTVSVVPIVGATTTRTINLLRLSVRSGAGGLARDGDLAVTRETCAIELESDSALATPSLLPGFAASLADQELTASFADATLRVAGALELRGCALDDPEGDPLPTSSDDPRVTDADGDGLPGLTVRIDIIGLGAIETYLVQREQLNLVGRFAADGSIDGAVEVVRLEQVVVGANNALFATTPELSVDAEASRFTMTRIDERTDCAAIVRAATML